MSQDTNVTNELLRALEARVDRIDRICMGCRDAVNGKYDGLATQLRRLDDRLRALEIRVAFYSGGAALVGTISGAIVGRII